MDIEPLKTSFRGQIVEPDDDDYDQSSKLYKGMIDKRPRLIARCANVADDHRMK